MLDIILQGLYMYIEGKTMELNQRKEIRTLTNYKKQLLVSNTELISQLKVKSKQSLNKQYLYHLIRDLNKENMQIKGRN